MMSLWDALRMNMMISYQELVRTFPYRCDVFIDYLHREQDVSVTAWPEKTERHR